MNGVTPPTLPRLAGYFLQLGALGFGGPVALANSMRRDLVERRGWISETEYDSGLAIAAACPGPLAYQLGVYCGYLRFGVPGGLLVAVAFGLAPFLLVVAAAAAYTRFADNWQLHALFYGVGPVVVALILKACWNLAAKTLRRDALAWTFAVFACGVTVVLERELTALFILAGILGAFLFAPAGGGRSLPRPAAAAPTPGTTALVVAAPLVSTSGMTLKLFLFFFKTGCLVFGSGLVIVPFLKTYVVDQYHWLGNRQFLDAVAIGMISPGPVVITATFVGYLVDGLGGALAATVGIFSPAVLFTVLATPLLLRYAHNRRLSGFIRGITVTVVGVLLGTTSLVARTAVGDVLTVGIAIVSLAVLASWKKCPDPLLVALGALTGLAAYQTIQPDWLLRQVNMHEDGGPVILFVCEHGSAKSVVAAAQLQRLARERGLRVRALARGLTPDPQVVGSAATGLLAEGIDVRGYRPAPVTRADLEAATRVVTLGCDPSRLSPSRAVGERWDDVPAVSEGYPAARDAIVKRIEGLLADIGEAPR